MMNCMIELWLSRTFYWYNKLVICYIHRSIITIKLIMVCLQVRDADRSDNYREKCVQLLDDFKTHGINGSRILYCVTLIYLIVRLFSFLLLSPNWCLLLIYLSDRQ